jgi:hypothetical protein
MKDQLDRLESKVDKTIDAVSEVGLAVARMEVHVDKNTADLENHIRRTDLAEVRIERLEKVEQWLRGAMWITMGLGTLLLAVAKLLEK